MKFLTHNSFTTLLRRKISLKPSVPIDTRDVFFCHINELSKDSEAFVECLKKDSKLWETRADHIESKIEKRSNNIEFETNFFNLEHLCLIEFLKFLNCCDSKYEPQEDQTLCYSSKHIRWRKGSKIFSHMLKLRNKFDLAYKMKVVDYYLYVYFMKQLNYKVHVILKQKWPVYELGTAFNAQNFVGNNLQFHSPFIRKSFFANSNIDCNLYKFVKILKIVLKNKHFFLKNFYKAVKNLKRTISIRNVDFVLSEKSIPLLLSNACNITDNYLVPLNIYENQNLQRTIRLFSPLIPVNINSDEINKTTCEDLIKISLLLYLKKCKNLEDCLYIFKCTKYVKEFYTEWYECFSTVINQSDKNFLLAIERDFPFNISVKIDYQHNFGAEKMTLHELIKEWYQLTFSEKTKCLRIRVNYDMTKIISVKEVTITTVKTDLKRCYAVDEKMLLTSLCSTITTLQSFPNGEYLLKYVAAKQNIILVYASKSPHSSLDSKIINIPEMYSNNAIKFQAQNKAENSELDPIELTKIHLMHSMAPNFFTNDK